MPQFSPLEALAYVKGILPKGDPTPDVKLPNIQDHPAATPLAGDLAVHYLVDMGDRFQYVTGTHMKSAGIDHRILHATAVNNLRTRAEGRVTLHASGSTSVLLFDGDFEASLILLDEYWDEYLVEHHGGDPVIAVPARDMLSFCSASCAEGVAELKDLVARVWRGGDHLISKQLYRRRDRQWLPHEPTA